MIDPLFWLGLSILLVAVSLTAMLFAALPAFRELARAARSAEKLFDTLNRELPPTLESIRLTGIEITDLTDEVSEGVQSAGQVVKQVDQSLRGVQRQAQQAQTTTRSVFAGVKAAWKTFRRPPRRSLDREPEANRLPASTRQSIDFDNRSHRSHRDEYPPEYRDPYDPEAPEWDDSTAEESYPIDRS
ncbi:hypothetical protein H6F67_00670 [Microcoleus sp. FACHB-1515]|uniref:hypothetical protein n=1 Tax=Cyanophyceae TaxID=3028117 RepID=UPI00168A3FB1|nr:hypothetical protein [Microcoleus sp. FACHB-1515]MBD2088385.1 hypothetical protein [Microcoleus sp. FACHB-1515]